jgi:hypothetical protein
VSQTIAHRYRLAALLALGLGLGVTTPSVHAERKSCEELAGEISAKLRAGGVTGYELEIVPASLAVGGQVVGSCDNGRQKITYAKVKAPGVAASGPRPRPRP